MVWGGVGVLRGVADVVRWPFERAAWAIERGVIWPLEERTGNWNGPLRAAGLAALVLVAAGAGVLGLVWASGSGGGGTSQPELSTAPVAAPIVKQARPEELVPAAPALHGASPDFTPTTGGAAKGESSSVTKASGEATGSTAAAAAPPVTPSSPPTTATTVEPAGPPATKVAQRFAGAFVLYETGKDNAKVRDVFAATATPQLTDSLLERPPRLPTDVEVPKAKVLNVVPGPKQGDTYTLSVSLLRVGVTSELRINMQRNEKSGRWQVTDVLG